MPLIRFKNATPGNIVLIDFSSKHEVGKSSEKRVNLLRQIVDQEKRFMLDMKISCGMLQNLPYFTRMYCIQKKPKLRNFENPTLGFCIHHTI